MSKEESDATYQNSLQELQAFRDTLTDEIIGSRDTVARLSLCAKKAVLDAGISALHKSMNQTFKGLILPLDSKTVHVLPGADNFTAAEENHCGTLLAYLTRKGWKEKKFDKAVQELGLKTVNKQFNPLTRAFSASRVDPAALYEFIISIGAVIGDRVNALITGGFSGDPVPLILSAGELAKTFARPIALAFSQDLSETRVGPTTNVSINYIKHADNTITIMVLRFKQACKITKRFGSIRASHRVSYHICSKWFVIQLGSEYLAKLVEPIYPARLKKVASSIESVTQLLPQKPHVTENENTAPAEAVQLSLPTDATLFLPEAGIHTLGDSEGEKTSFQESHVTEDENIASTEAAQISLPADATLFLSQVRMYLLGDSGVGKTSFLRNLTGSSLPRHEKRTAVAKTYQLRVTPETWSDVSMDKLHAAFSLQQYDKQTREKKKSLDTADGTAAQPEPLIHPSTSTKSVNSLPSPSSSSSPIEDTVISSDMTSQKTQRQEDTSSLIKAEFESSKTPLLGLNVWDCGGQTVYLNVYQMLLSANALYFIVLKLSWEQETLLSRLRYWTSILKETLYPDEACNVYVVVTHEDHCASEAEKVAKKDALNTELNKMRGISSHIMSLNNRECAQTIHKIRTLILEFAEKKLKDTTRKCEGINQLNALVALLRMGVPTNKFPYGKLPFSSLDTYAAELNMTTAQAQELLKRAHSSNCIELLTTDNVTYAFINQRVYTSVALSVISTPEQLAELFKDKNGDFICAHLRRGVITYQMFQDILIRTLEASTDKDALTTYDLSAHFATATFTTVALRLLEEKGLASRYGEWDVIIPALLPQDLQIFRPNFASKSYWEPSYTIPPAQSSHFVCWLIHHKDEIISALRGSKHRIKPWANGCIFTTDEAQLIIEIEYDSRTAIENSSTSKLLVSLVGARRKHVLEKLYSLHKSQAFRQPTFMRRDKHNRDKTGHALNFKNLISIPRRLHQSKSSLTGLDIDNKRLAELHTHLLGMGASEFWLNWVMQTFIPASVDWMYGPRVDWGPCKLLKLLFNLKQRDPGLSDCFSNEMEKLATTNLPHTSCKCKGLVQACFKELLSVLEKKGGRPESQPTLDDMRLLFTNDVVYPYSTLCEAFLGVMKGNPDFCDRVAEVECLSALEKLLGNASTPTTFRAAYKEYLVYNVRKQQFQLVTGLPNRYLLEVMELSQQHFDNRSHRALAIEAAVKNCFSMLNRDGTAPKMADLSTYRGCFTPKFYPMRFALKDPLYEQYPYILSMLLNSVIARYAKAHVHYVEFSLGISDASRPWMWVYLREDAIWGQPATKTRQSHLPPWVEKAGWYNPRPAQFTYKFLAAFPRTFAKFPVKQSGEYMHLDEWFSLSDNDREAVEFKSLPLEQRRHFVANAWPHYAIMLKMQKQALRGTIPVVEASGEISVHNRSVYDKFIKKMFPAFVCKEKLEPLRKNDRVVGLDLVGEEDGFPFSPFLHSAFQSLILLCKKRNPWFGVRLHGGEGVKRGSSCFKYEQSTVTRRNFGSHMSIIHQELVQLLNLTKYGKKACLRVGHGVAFSYPGILQISPDETFTRELTVNFPIMRKWLKCNCVPLELNMTSNNTLLSDMFNNMERITNEKSVLSFFLREGLSVVLSTDDDGVWPIHKCKEHYRHISVLHEFCQAVLSNSITTKTDLHKLIDCAWDNRFFRTENN